MKCHPLHTLMGKYLLILLYYVTLHFYYTPNHIATHAGVPLIYTILCQYTQMYNHAIK